MFILGAGSATRAARGGAARRPMASSRTTTPRRAAPRPCRAAAAAPSPPDQPAATATTTATTTATAPPQKTAIIKVPKSIFDVDNGRILGFGPDLAPDHPGYGDAAYTARRTAIAQRALAHVPGTPPPLVDYTREEQETWRAVLERLTTDLLPRHACKEYLNALDRLAFDPGRVPQLREVDELLRREAGGWRIRPVAGLMHPRDFLAGLAFRTFHSTQYCRHASTPQYTPEPDVIHELVGHVPMLLCPAYARMAEAIGRASLGADEAKLWHLIKVYWYSVEFGVVWEEAGEGGGGAGGRVLKAFGAGILSSLAELEWMGSGAAAGGVGAERPYGVLPLDPTVALPRMSYKDGVQRTYYALESFDQGAALLEAYAREGGPAPPPKKRGEGGDEQQQQQRRSAR